MGVGTADGDMVLRVIVMAICVRLWWILRASVRGKSIKERFPVRVGSAVSGMLVPTTIGRMRRRLRMPVSEGRL